MRFYQIPFFVKLFFPNYIWEIHTKEKTIYITFDDGPTQELTPWILETLAAYNAKATFFCVGQNVEKHPELLMEIIHQKHSIGNHTYSHLKGRETDTKTYIEDVEKWSRLGESKLFRPPYGKMSRAQGNAIKKLGYKIIMWSLLTYDFDKTISPDLIFAKIKKHTKAGSILVFHDNIKAEENLKTLLPKTLKYFSEQGYNFKAI